MARIGRLAGALLVEAGGQWWLVGNTKEPCDWRAHGFESPPEIDAVKRPCLSLHTVGTPTISGPHLVVEGDGEELARRIARRMLVERNGSVSERLWRLILGANEADDAPRGRVDARWLVEIPEPVWRVVRDAVLQCL